MVEHGMEFGWLFIVIFSIFIVLGVIHLVNSIGDKKKEKTYEGSPFHKCEIRIDTKYYLFEKLGI